MRRPKRRDSVGSCAINDRASMNPSSPASSTSTSARSGLARFATASASSPESAHADHGHALRLEQRTRGGKECLAVVDDETSLHHLLSISETRLEPQCS